MPTQIWAHRGASAYAPENTMPAFEEAVRMGAHGLELDVHLSRDGELVVIHDETVDRTSNGTGKIADLSLTELKKLDFSNGFLAYNNNRIPTLSEVYEFIRPTKLMLNVEIKCDVVMYWGIWDKLISLEHEAQMQGRILYSSFNHTVLPYIRALDAGSKIGLLYSGVPKDPIQDAKVLAANAIHPHYLAVLLQPELIKACKDAGIAIHTWTVDDPAAISALIKADVEAVITNRPDIAISISKLI